MNLSLAHIHIHIAINIRMNNLALLQLLRLSSPTLPIGSYAYSQGLETACHNEYVTSQETLSAWIQGLLTHSIQYLDIPIFSRLYDAHKSQDRENIEYWNNYVLACRETHELLLEDTQMGGALARLLIQLGLQESALWKKTPCSLLTMFSLACAEWNIDKATATHGLIWAWCENQVGIGIKLIPLGQSQGQLILSELMPTIELAVNNGLAVDDDSLGASCPGAIIASMQHEEQYTRLFRS